MRVSIFSNYYLMHVLYEKKKLSNRLDVLFFESIGKCVNEFKKKLMTTKGEKDMNEYRLEFFVINYSTYCLILKISRQTGLMKWYFVFRINCENLKKDRYKHSLKSIIEIYQRNRNNNSDAEFVLFSRLHNRIYVSLQIDQV